MELFLAIFGALIVFIGSLNVAYGEGSSKFVQLQIVKVILLGIFSLVWGIRSHLLFVGLNAHPDTFFIMLIWEWVFQTTLGVIVGAVICAIFEV